MPTQTRKAFKTRLHNFFIGKTNSARKRKLGRVLNMFKPLGYNRQRTYHEAFLGSKGSRKILGRVKNFFTSFGKKRNNQNPPLPAGLQAAVPAEAVSADLENNSGQLERGKCYIINKAMESGLVVKFIGKNTSGSYTFIPLRLSRDHTWNFSAANKIVIPRNKFEIINSLTCPA